MAQVPTKVTYKDAIVEIKAKASPIIRRFLFDIERRMKISLTGAKSGKLYARRGKTRRGGRRSHRASAPGEAPATDTGFLMSGIRARMQSQTQGVITIAAPYAIWLEEGTRFMLPRPFIRPAIDGAIARVQKGFNVTNTP